jgi:hypothetical protein
MPLAGTVVFEVETGGNDSNTGGFDPGATFTLADLATTNGNAAGPVVSSSYHFQTTDVGAWAFVSAGAQWVPGFYQIASVINNQATLKAGIGQAVLYPSFQPNTAVGVATAAAPSGNATWAIDYSQQSAPPFTFSDLTSSSPYNTITSAAHQFGGQWIGNLLNLASTGGFTAGIYEIVSVSGTAAGLDRACASTGTPSGGTGSLGGALASLGQAGALAAASSLYGVRAFVQSGNYNITSATQNTPGGCVLWRAGASTPQRGSFIIGYGTVRGDFGPRPTLNASSGTIGATILTTGTGNYIAGLIINGAGVNSVQGINTAGTGSIIYRCKVENCTQNAINSADASTLVVLCELTGCSSAWAGLGAQWYFSAIHDNTGGGLSTPSLVAFCLVTNNTGAGQDGVSLAARGSCAINTTVNNSGRDGIRITAGTLGMALINNVSTNSGTMNYDATGATDEVLMLNNGWYGGAAGLSTALSTNKIFGTVALTALPFVNAGGDNYAPNSTPGGGQAAIGVGVGSGKLVVPGLSAPSYIDLGAAQVPPNPLLSTNQVLALVDQTRQTVQFTVTAQTVNFGKPVSSTTMVNSIYDWANYGGLLWGGGRYASSGSAPCLFSSADGVNWKEQTAAVPFGGDAEVRTLLASADGNLYLGTTTGGGTPPTIYKYDGTSWTAVATASGQTNIRSFADGPDGLVYAATTCPSGSHPVLLYGGAHTFPAQTWNTVSGTPWSLTTSKVDRVILANFLGPGGTMYASTSDAQSGGTGGIFAAATTPSNGANWSLISPPSGFSTSGASAGGVEAHKMALFKGQYYTSTHDKQSGASVWVSSDLGHTWTPVPSTALGFGIGPTEEEAYHLYVYDDTLFVGTLNGTLGGGIWYTQNGLDWLRIGSPGMGDPVNNSGYYHLIAFQNRLWVAPHGYSISSPTIGRPYSIQRFANTGTQGAGGAGVI